MTFDKFTDGRKKVLEPRSKFPDIKTPDGAGEDSRFIHELATNLNVKSQHSFLFAVIRAPFRRPGALGYRYEELNPFIDGDELKIYCSSQVSPPHHDLKPSGDRGIYKDSFKVNIFHIESDKSLLYIILF